MPFNPKPGNFSLFRNTKKSSSNHPDYQLKIIFDQDLITDLQQQLDEGKTPTLYGGAWVKQRDDADPFISGIAKPPFESQPASEEVVEDMLAKTPIRGEEAEEAPAQESVPHEEQSPPEVDDLPFVLTIPIAIGSLIQFLI